MLITIIILLLLANTVLIIYAGGLRKRLRESIADNYELEDENIQLTIDKTALDAERMNLEQKLTDQRAKHIADKEALLSEMEGLRRHIGTLVVSKMELHTVAQQTTEPQPKQQKRRNS